MEKCSSSLTNYTPTLKNTRCTSYISLHRVNKKDFLVCECIFIAMLLIVNSCKAPYKVRLARRFLLLTVELISQSFLSDQMSAMAAIWSSFTSCICKWLEFFIWIQGDPFNQGLSKANQSRIKTCLYYVFERWQIFLAVSQI